MPWNVASAKKHNKSMTDAEAKQWVAVANSALAKCTKAGGSNCDASAIQQANGVISKSRKAEAFIGAAEIIVEAGKMISAANHSKLKDAVGSIQSAMDTIMPLIADDTTPTTNESIASIIDTDNVLMEAGKILAQSDSYNATRMLVQSALRKRAMLAMMADTNDEPDYYSMNYCDMPWIRDLYDGYVVYEGEDDDLFQCDYSITNGVVTLGTETPVQISYVPTDTPMPDTSDEDDDDMDEANKIEIVGDLIKLQEKAVRDDGTARIKLIDPGWGSSGYYSKEVLSRDGPKVFKAGLHMYMNHPTAQEDKDRPERDVRDLVGVQKTEAVWEDASPKNTGPGLYADAVVFDHYKSFVDEAAPYIGVSIRAAGTASEGVAENRKGIVINTLDEGYSVDYVTMPGRGGQVMPLFESARNKVAKTDIEIIASKEVVTVDITPEKLKELEEAAERGKTLEAQLAESNKNMARMQEGLILRDAREIVIGELAKIKMPTFTYERLLAQCSANPPIKDGAIDREALIESVKTVTAEELKYIQSVAGTTTGGRVVGMSAPIEETVTDADVEKALTESFQSWGLSERGVAVAVKGN